MSVRENEPRLTSLAHGGGCGCKIAPNVLREILGAAPVNSAYEALMVDAATSDDAAVYKISDEVALIATTDFFMPIVDDPFEFGRIAATNALSDVYAMGGRPIFSLAIVGMPIGKMSTETIRKILDGGRAVSEAAGAPVAGGHSIDSAEPIYGLVAMGLAHPDRILRNANTKPGDVLILGKPLGVGIFSAALKREILSPSGYDAMIQSTTLLNRPGADLAQIDGVHAITDVTGFGLLGHLTEMCKGSSVAAEIDQNAVPIFDEAKTLLADGVKTGASGRNWESIKDWVDAPAELRDMLTDPQTSGGLLVSCHPDSAAEVIETFKQHGHTQACVIGEVREGSPFIQVR
ncbi:selenide, water dikinase SelD [Hyphococcus sp. DH-69]|uniref:selenide, water dikinase SelD n=1 Tax=Hyphococcus formosus TaxID=3143534 RepID=UPI00398A9745